LSAPSPGIARLGFVKVAARDPAAAEANYGRILGRTPSARGADGDPIYRLDNAGVALVAGEGEGIAGLDFVVADAARATAALRDGGARGLAITFSEDRAEETPLAALRDGVLEAEAAYALDHVVVMTADAESCRQLFGERLGIRLALDQTRPEWGVRQLFFRLAGMTVEVVQSLDPAKQPKSDRYWGLAWKMRDIAAACERLKREGADVSEVRQGRKPGTKVATVRRDTEGVPTLLIEHPKS
jgi:catechol 2,3-dioxygenase-like lactoylglutathione lyase family enzyme